MFQKIRSRLFQTGLAAIYLFSLSLSSCKESETIEITPKLLNGKASIAPARLGSEQHNLSMERFAVLLSKVVSTDRDLRSFLKEEAIKQFDLDYDILYHSIKDAKISGKESLHDKLLKHCDESELTEIEFQLPLLTIFVPELPSGFSAESWDTNKDIPSVSTATIKNGEVAFYQPEGSIVSIKAEYIPGIPLLIIKDNERVQVAGTQNKSKTNESGSRISTDSYMYEFISDTFNASKDNVIKRDISAKSECVNCVVDDKTVTAYDLGLSNPSLGLWQRDYIYYSLTPASPNGPLDTRYQEHLTSIKFNTGLQAYQHITDQDPDPVATKDGKAQWAEGSYEFNLTVLINNTTGLGATITKLFPVRGWELFNVTYKLSFANPFFPVYVIDVITPKQYNLNIPIAAWDIKSNGIGWKIMMSEVDPSQTYTDSNVLQSMFAGNFGLDFSKIGLKFGLTPTFTNTQTHTMVTQLASDQLGDAAMYFYDPIITNDDLIPSHGPWYQFKDLDLGWVTVNIQPRRVF